MQSKLINKSYFDVDKEQFQQAVNRLNIQARLSKQQLNNKDVNGYRKIKVIILLYQSLFYINIDSRK